MLTKNILIRDLLVFFTVTFLISWSMAGLILCLDLPEFPSVIPLIYGPALSGIITSLYFYGWKDTVKYLKRLTIVRVHWKWYLFLTVGFCAMGYAAVWLYEVIAGVEWYRNVNPVSALLPVLVFQLLLPGLGEETGWRGFALNRLQHLSNPLLASVILGLVHWFWHLPTYWLGTGMHNVPAIWSLLYVIPWAILFTWVYNHTRGSIFIAALFHGLHGVMLSLINFLPRESDLPITPDLLTSLSLDTTLLGPYFMMLALLWVLSALVAKGYFGGFGHPPHLEQKTLTEN